MGTRYIHRPDAAKPWRAEWYDYYTRPGKRLRGGTRTFETPGEADRWIDEQEAVNAAYWGQTGSGRSRTTARTFGAFASGWLATQAHISATTRKQYHSIIRRLNAHLGADTPLAAITRDDIRRMISDLVIRQERNPGTVRRYMAVLRAVMDHAVQSGIITVSPCVGVDVPRYVNRRSEIVRPAQIGDVIAAMPARLGAAVQLAWATGMRIGEVAGLQVSSLDLQRGRVTIAGQRHNDGSTSDRAKNGRRDQWVALDSETVRSLSAHLAAYPASADGYVFTLQDGNGPRGVPQKSLRRYFKRACKQAGLPESVRFHDLRHSCATLMAEKETPPYVIQRQLRHGSLATSDRYIQEVNDQELSRWVNTPHRPVRPVRAA